MEHTFITVHDTSPDARITFASASIEQILGYRPEEVYMRSSFDFFHPEEVPFARRVHSRGLRLDKAAVLHYARLRGKDGRWIGCECCFTVVYNVLVACISLYRRGTRSEQRAKDAPLIRRLFSCSPRDPRYHMLEYLSPKFTSVPVEREPRGALILNRFSRNLTIMHATFAVDSILGGRSLEEIRGSSFYDYIEDDCVPEAERCLESAKSNDSIAYLRFWVKDARAPAQGPDVAMNDEEDSDPDSDNGGVRLSSADVDGRSQVDGPSQQNRNENGNGQQIVAAHNDTGPGIAAAEEQPQGIEVEAVVSCASDGLVVIIRKARPLIPALQQPRQPAAPYNQHHGLFAAPWGREIIRPNVPLDQVHQFHAPLRPEYMPLREPVKPVSGPPDEQFMMAIKDVAVFAWALVGINGNFAKHCKGVPQGEAQPPDGFPVWDPAGGDLEYQGPENQAALRWARLGKAAQTPMGSDIPYGSYAPDSQFGGAPRMYHQPQGYVERHTYMHSVQRLPQYSTSPYTFGQQQEQQQHQPPPPPPSHLQQLHPHQRQYQQHEDQYHQQQQALQYSQTQQAPRGLWSPHDYVRDGVTGDAWQQDQRGQGDTRTPSSVPHNGSSTSSGLPTTQTGDSGYSTQNEFRWP
ncbi:hypothetical protein MCOR25_008915 [Pyricularia grisea]|nr:hypothetical protein MCOR25_008915 [Pyricularia grisea]